MTLQQVLDFLAIAENGSAHAAARATGQTQPALTKSLRRLEQTLGAPLFVRLARGVQLNDFGRRFLAHAQRLASEAKQARDAMQQALGERSGSVVFGVSAAASLLLAPAAIKRFRRAYPGVELHSRSGLYHTLAPLLRDGQLDFMICPLPHGGVDATFALHTLFESPAVLVARRDHPLARVRRLAALEQADFVMVGPRDQPRRSIYAAFARAGLGVPSVMLHTDSVTDCAAIVAGSDCLALMPAALMKSGLLRERLVAVPVADELPSYAVTLFQRAQAPLTPAAAALAGQFERESAYRRAE